MKRQDSAGYLANHMARLFKAMLNDQLAPLGLFSASLGILLELWASDGLSQSDLVERLDIEQATVAGTLARMERDGLVRRRTDPADGRRQIVTLTVRAKSLEAAATATAQATNQTALAGLTAAERTTFLVLMRRVIATQRKTLNKVTAS